LEAGLGVRRIGRKLSCCQPLANIHKKGTSSTRQEVGAPQDFDLVECSVFGPSATRSGDEIMIQVFCICRSSASASRRLPWTRPLH
jgi:hypothetical protein